MKVELNITLYLFQLHACLGVYITHIMQDVMVISLTRHNIATWHTIFIVSSEKAIQLHNFLLVQWWTSLFALLLYGLLIMSCNYCCDSCWNMSSFIILVAYILHLNYNDIFHSKSSRKWSITIKLFRFLNQNESKYCKNEEYCIF